jgi:hypothetical protein
MRICASVVLFLALAGRVSAQDVEVRSSVDRTAMWVADRVTYTIELTCKRGIDILTDDLSRDKVTLEGLDFLGSDMSRRPARDDGIAYQFKYYVTTYRVDAPTLRIAPLTVRYYARRAGQRVEDAVPSGEVRVPGASIAFRSMLPDDEAVTAIRADRPAPDRPVMFAILQPVGLGLVIVAIVPAIVAATALVARRRARRTKRSWRSPRGVREDARRSLEEVRSIDLSTLDGRREAFTRLDALVRAHLRDVCGIPGQSLTPTEVVPALASSGSRTPAELVRSLLTACELARYASPGTAPSAEACRQAVDETEQLIAAGR